MSKSKDEVYKQRNMLAILVARMALMLNYSAGWGTDEEEDSQAWNTVVYVDLPTGQISFHMCPETKPLAQVFLPKYERGWDGCWWKSHFGRIIHFFDLQSATGRDKDSNEEEFVPPDELPF